MMEVLASYFLFDEMVGEVEQAPKTLYAILEGCDNEIWSQLLGGIQCMGCEW